MRKLTITRTKSFVGCLIDMQIYIETPNSGSTTINGITCAKIGDLKNGETKTFDISDNTAKVYVIADSISKEYCNDFYQLPEGSEDITLTGRNRFSLLSGNAYIFDNNDNPEVKANRKKNKRRGWWMILLAIVLGAIGGVIGGLIAAGVF